MTTSYVSHNVSIKRYVPERQ